MRRERTKLKLEVGSWKLERARISIQLPTSNLQLHPGFTLVELLIAATMMSVLFIGLGSHLRAGISVWRLTTQRVDALQRERIALDRLERDLANSVLYDQRDDAYGSEEGKLPPPQFGATSLAWYTVSPTTQRPSVRFVTYACEPREDTTSLWRTSQSVGEARAKREPSKELLLPGCESLRVRYAYEPPAVSEALDWRETWLFSKELPRLMEVTVRMSSGREVGRVIAIPQGSLKQAPP